MKKRVEFQVKQLARLMAYILGHRPDEFGLVPEDDGSVSLKELVQAIIEEEGWSHVRLSHIEQAAYSCEGRPFEIRDDRIRMLNAPLPSSARHPVEPPPLLYFAARRKAYAHILQNGLNPGAKPFVPLAATEELALRMGRRRDPQPILLTIQARQAYEEGCTFTRPQELIYLVESLPLRHISGPPLEQMVDIPAQKAQKAQPSPQELPAIEDDTIRIAFGMGRKEKKSHTEEPVWKRSARKFRRQRQR